MLASSFLEWHRLPSVVFEYRAWLQGAHKEVNEKEELERDLSVGSDLSNVVISLYVSEEKICRR